MTLFDKAGRRTKSAVGHEHFVSDKLTVLLSQSECSQQQDLGTYLGKVLFVDVNCCNFC